MRPKKTTAPKGLRIQLKGLRTTQELRAMLHEAVDGIEAKGITHLRGSNLYVTPCDGDGNPVIRYGRHKLQDFSIEEPYPSAAEEHGL
jgi:hypothetical protein